MLRFLAQRLLQSVLVLWAIVTVTFFLIKAAPGGPFAAEKATTSAVKEQIEAAYGLNQSPLVQYASYWGRLLRGDLGPSYKYEGWSVNELIASSFPISLRIGFSALLLALLVGVPLGIFAAVRKNSPADYVSMSLAMIGICLPTFVVGPLLALVFAIRLKWFNVAGWYETWDWVLPAVTLALPYTAYLARMTRGSVLEVLTQDFIRTARAKGVAWPLVVARHALRPSLQPVVAYLGPALAGLVTGSFIVENVFQLPGLGQHFVAAAVNRDYMLLLGTTVFYATMLIGMNLLGDLAQAWLNPRVRLTE